MCEWLPSNDKATQNHPGFKLELFLCSSTGWDHALNSAYP